MKTRILTLTLLAGIAYGQTYLSAVDGNNQVTATTKGYVDAADGALQTQIDALVPSGVVATVTANGVQYGASEGNITITQQFATVSGDNVSAFALDKVQFDTSATNTLAEGEMGWNADDGTASLGLPGGNVQLQVGQESLIRTKADSTTVSNGWVAYQVGFASARPTIDVHNGGHAPLGIATEDINSSNGGYVTLRGFVRNVDTSGYDLNAELYASTNGPAVTNRPAYPNEAFQVGRVASVHATEGIILAQTPTCSKTWTELDEQYKASYATLYIHDGTNTVTITATTNYFPVTIYNTNDVIYGCTSTISNITVLSSGVYKLTNYMSFSGQASQTYECAFFINGNHNDCGEFERKLGATGDIGSASGGCIVRLNANDVVDIRIKASGFSTLPLLKQSTFMVEKIGN